MYVVPEVPPVTSPVVVSNTAPSVGTGLKAKVPPVSPVMIAVPPSQVGVKVKLASTSESITLISKSIVSKQSVLKLFSILIKIVSDVKAFILVYKPIIGLALF